ncbi:hypothetical protein PENSUB_2333 [Penicillium subrubescens]|uniref:DUF3824 domain-containing protein n=1 Tax=Penicillium subrubescens TaxID=1316194 RepID=A0A1Q5UI90_9EURO|nr:hypothetical protein PENSUB_2333 [Penicillium subrubescens]
MAYYDDRRHYAPRDRGRPAAGYAADYYDDHPRGFNARNDREVYSPRGGEGSVEEIQRDYPPGSDYVYERGYDSRRSRRPVYENVRRASSVGGYDPYYDNGYYRSRTRRTRQSDDHRKWSLFLTEALASCATHFILGILNPVAGPRRSRYSSASSSSPSPSRHRRRKSFGETALGALGLGSVASRQSDRTDRTDRGRARSSSRRRGRDYSSSRSRSRSRDRDRNHRQRSEQRLAQAARAALTAGAVEAFKSRKDPGDWTGAKGKRILTAAVTAAGADGLIDKDPKKHSGRHVVESTLAGLAASHFVRGGSSSKGRDGRGRSGSGLKDLAATGALAAAGKEIYDRMSRSRSRPRGRDDRDRDSDDDRRGSKKRSKSVSEYITKGMAALGFGEEASDRGRHDRNRDRDDESLNYRYDPRRERRHHRDRDSRYDSYSDSDTETDYRSRNHRHGRGSRDVGRNRSLNGNKAPPIAPTSAPRGEMKGLGSSNRGSHSSSESDSDLGDSSDEKEKRKKLKRDMLLTSGLATVATIHAAHGVYGGIQKRKERMQQVKDGEITQEEARKRRIKANTIDAFSVGLAALGIKGAYGEWKEVNEKRKETKHFRDECAQRAIKREMRRCRSQGSAPNSRRRWPDEIEYPDSHHGHGSGFSYNDGNPYGATSEAPAISY